VTETAEAVSPIAIRTPMSTFSRNGLRIWRRKVIGKRERMKSVAIVMPVLEIDTFENV